MDDFTLGLALYDFVPVLFTGIAVYFIALMAQLGDRRFAAWAFTGAGLVLAAGLLKATWKLNATLTGQDVVWMANALFPLMAPGFVLLAAGFWRSRRQLVGKRAPAWLWLLPLALIGGAYCWAGYRTWIAPVERGWFMPVMNLASLGNITLTVLLFVAAWRQGKRGLALLFTVNLAMVFALIPIAQIEPKSIALHWFEQTLTAVGAATFAWAAYRLHHQLVEGRSTVGRFTGMPVMR